MPYQFRLEAVRRVRQTHRDELRGRLAEAFSAADKLAEQRRQIASQLERVEPMLGEAASVGTLDVERVMGLQRWQMLLRGQLADIDQKAKLVEEEIQRRQSAVAAAEQQVKTLDLLDDRYRTQAQQQERRAEAKADDEAAGAVWRRSASASVSTSLERKE